MHGREIKTGLADYLLNYSLRMAVVSECYDLKYNRAKCRRCRHNVRAKRIPARGAAASVSTRNPVERVLVSNLLVRHSCKKREEREWPAREKISHGRECCYFKS